MAGHPTLAGWVEDCRRVAGRPVEFVATRESGGAAEAEHEANGGVGAGEAAADAAALRALCAAAATEPVISPGDGGRWAAAVPLRAAGVTLGHLVIAHETEAMAGEAGEGGRERLDALVRVLRLVAERLAREIGEAGEENSPLVEEACQIVQAEYCHPLSLGELARRLEVSEGHLSRAFHHAAGVRFVDYLARVRVERARVMLETTARPVAEVARACGFTSLSQFHRVFRARLAETPRDARRRAATGPVQGGAVPGV